MTDLRTASSINTYLGCPKKYEYSYVDLYKSRLPIPAFLIGSVVHKGLEHYWLRDSWEDTLAAMVEQQCSEHHEWWGSETGKLEWDRCVAYVKGYFAKWIKQDLTTYDVVSVEHEFLNGVRAGKLDVLLRRKSDNQLVIMEHKTAGPYSKADEPGSVYWQRLPMDTQACFYLHNIEKTKGERPIIIYDVVMKTASKPQRSRARQRKDEKDTDFQQRKAEGDETPAAYRQRVTKAYCTEAERYIRREVVVTEEELALKMAEIDQTIEKMTAPFARNTTSCAMGSSACAFLDVCTGQDTLDGGNYIIKEQAHSELSPSKENPGGFK